jgi:hypothetical protein
VTVDAHELTQTVLCKVDGCENEAAATRGPLARLCAKHAAERKYGKRHRERSNSTYEGKVKALQQAGRRLDKATAAVEAAGAELEDAKRAWNQAVDQLGVAELRSGQ